MMMMTSSLRPQVLCQRAVCRPAPRGGAARRLHRHPHQRLAQRGQHALRHHLRQGRHLGAAAGARRRQPGRERGLSGRRVRTGRRPGPLSADLMPWPLPPPLPQLSKGCSLHLAQRWSQLFNIQLRRVPILSKDSAPGLIMATGESAGPAGRASKQSKPLLQNSWR